MTSNNGPTAKRSIVAINGSINAGNVTIASTTDDSTDERQIVDSLYANNGQIDTDDVSIGVPANQLSTDGNAPSCVRKPKVPMFHFDVKGSKLSIEKEILLTKASHLAKLFPEGADTCKIEDVPPKVFGALLHFVEHGKLAQTTDEEVGQLLFALMDNNNKYKTDKVKDCCEQFLIAKLCTKNSGPLLVWSKKNKAGTLKEIADKYVDESS